MLTASTRNPPDDASKDLNPVFIRARRKRQCENDTLTIPAAIIVSLIHGHSLPAGVASISSPCRNQEMINNGENYMRYIYKRSKYHFHKDDALHVMCPTLNDPNADSVTDVYDNRDLAITAALKDITALRKKLKADNITYTSELWNNTLTIRLSDGTTYCYHVESVIHNTAMTIALMVLFSMIVVLGVCCTAFGLFLFCHS